jgi:hypothetical protein
MSGERVCFAFALLLLTFSLAVFPTLITGKPAEGETGPFWFWSTIGVAGWLVFYWVLWSFLARCSVLATIALITIFSLSLFLRVLLYEVSRFSGFGFSDHFFFLHLEPESLRVAWAQFPDRIILGVVAILVLATVATWLARKIPLLPTRIRFIAAIAAPLMLWSARETLPEWQFVQGWWRWKHPEHTVALAPHRLAIWQESGLVETRLTAKETIKVALPEKPLNLIVVYIESFGIRLIDHPKWPGLTPNLSALLRSHALADFVHASSSFTLMGTVNSQCGTLFPFEQYLNNGNNVLAGGDLLGERFTCMGDVLRSAGYRQTYMVGAIEQFAGFDSFLRAHGYDDIKGLNHWKASRVYEGGEDAWGLTDVSLLEQAHNEIAALRRTGRPFNITIQTSGTHIPGYRFKECQTYHGAENRFLDAIHCTDQLIGRFVERLDLDGQFKDTVLILTADHNLWDTSEMKSLFGDTVHDHRLPLIVMGPRPDLPAARIGALYDLAPTILDLLRIRHNVRFPLGRSLVGTTASRDYFFSLDYGPVFFDALKENYIRQKTKASCVAQPPDGPLHFPLMFCERKELSMLLSSQWESLTNSQPRLNCTSGFPAEILIPNAGEAPLEVKLQGDDQADRFVWGGHTLHTGTKGLFLLRFAHDGKLVERLFQPADLVSKMEGLPQGGPDDRWLIIWRADSEAVPPKWLEKGKGQSGIWWATTQKAIQELPAQNSSRGLSWELTPESCRRHLTAFQK